MQPRGREIEARQSENRRGTQTAARNGRPDGEAPTPAIQRRGRATKRRWDNGRKAGAKTHKQRRRQLEAERRRAGSKERPTSAKHTKKTRGSRQQAATRRGGSRSRMRTTPKKRDRGTPGTTSLGWRQGHTQNHHRWDGDGDIPRVIVAGMAAGAKTPTKEMPPRPTSFYLNHRSKGCTWRTGLLYGCMAWGVNQTDYDAKSTQSDPFTTSQTSMPDLKKNPEESPPQYCRNRPRYA